MQNEITISKVGGRMAISWDASHPAKRTLRERVWNLPGVKSGHHSGRFYPALFGFKHLNTVLATVRGIASPHCRVVLA